MFATLYLPNFYLQAALRHQPELAGKPVGLIDDHDKKVILIQLNNVGEAKGIRIGMSPSQGLARCLDLVVKVRSQTQEKILQELLLHFAGTLSPYVEATGPGLATVEFTDPRNIAVKTATVVRQLTDSEITIQAGIAPTPDASFLAAHLAKPLLQIQDAREFLAELPIEVLAISVNS
jgi:hypothetical protein